MNNDSDAWLAFEPLVMRLIDHAEIHASVSPHDSEQLQFETDLLSAAEIIRSMWQCISLLSGCDDSSAIEHTYQGLCPDEIDTRSRDNDCPACKLLMRFSA